MRLFHKHPHHNDPGPRRFAHGRFGLRGHGPHSHEPHEHGERQRGGRLARLLEHGDLRMLVLHLINETPRHGYEIIKAIEDLTGGAYAPSPGVIYPTLTLLEETGQLTSTTEGSRKSYAVTAAGVKTLAENQPTLAAMLARIAGAQRSEPAPPVLRAMENLKTALRFKFAGKPLTPDIARKIADTLDAAARTIEDLA